MVRGLLTLALLALTLGCGSEQEAAELKEYVEAIKGLDSYSRRVQAEILRFDDPRIDARGLQLQRRGQSREAGADDDRVMLVNLGQASVPGTPHSAGFGSPGRPDRQQSAGQKSWLGPSLPKLSRSEFELMRSSMSSRTMPT